MLRRTIAACVILLTATACSQPVAPPTSRVSVPEQALTTIRVAAFRNEVSTDLDQLIAAFQQKYAEYRVEKVLFDAGQKGRGQLEEAAMAGAVDVLPGNALEPSRRNMVLRALDGFLAQGSLDQARFGQLLEEMKLDGRVVQLPYTVYPFLLVYNKEMAQAAGVTIPETGWTWDEFGFALRKLTQGQGETKVWGLDSIFQQDFVHMYLQQKSKVPIWQANYEQLRDVLGFFNTLAVVEQSIKPLPGADISASGISRSVSWGVLKSFNERTAAMTYEPPFHPAYLRARAQVPWDIAPMPAHPGTKPIVHVQPQALGIAFNSQQAEAAWKFVAFAAGPEGAEIVARGGAIPVYASEAALKAWADQKHPPALESIWNATWISDLPSQSPNGFGMRHLEASKAVEWSLSGQKSVEDAIGYFKNLP